MRVVNNYESNGLQNETQDVENQILTSSTLDILETNLSKSAVKELQNILMNKNINLEDKDIAYFGDYLLTITKHYIKLN